MKITNRKLLLILVALTSILWQPSHHSLMHHGMAMNSGVHVLVTSVPFLALLLALSKTKWDW